MEPAAASLLNAVDLVYCAAENDARWDAFLNAVADALGGRSATLLSHSLHGRGGVSAVGRMDPATANLYDQYFHRCDPFAQKLSRKVEKERSGIYTGEMLIDRSDFLRTEFFNDFCCHQHITKMVTVVFRPAVSLPDETITALTVQRDEGDEFFDASCFPFLEQLMPHLARACGIRERLRHSEQEAKALGAVLQTVQTAGLLVDSRGRILRMNAKADALFARSAALVVRGGVLITTSIETTARLSAAIRSAARRRTTDRCVGDSLVISSHPLPPLRVTVSPASDDSPLEPQGVGGLVLVLIDEPTVGTQPDIDLLRNSYGLTQTEAEIARCFALGESIKAIAEARRNTKETVRWYSKQILAKTGCRSRSQLVRRLILQLGPIERD